MSERPAPRSFKGLVVLALGWTGLLWLGVDISQRILAAGGSQALAPSSHAEALLAAAEAPMAAAWAEADLAAAERMAVEALLASPLDPGALTLLGVAADARGEQARAKELLDLAASRSPADLLAQAWLFRHRLAADDVGGALHHADILLRVRPELLERLLPALTALAAEPERVLPLAQHLAGKSPWRERFLQRLARTSADPLAPFGLFAALAASATPPTQAELRPYLLRLVEARRYDQARLLWIEALPADRLAEAGYLVNGGFEEEPTGFIFDWELAPVAGATAEIAAGPEHEGGRALRVQFLDRRVPFRHVKQLLMLMPGRYRLTGRVKADGLDNERGLHWSLTCADGAAARLGASERVRGTAPWHPFEVSFEVPAVGCKAQWLTLELAARIPSESHAAGAAWYDDLAVTRIEEPDDCPDEGSPHWPHPAPSAQAMPPEAMQAPAAEGEAQATAEDEDGQCTCQAPAGTRAELAEVEGEVLVLRGDRWLAAKAEEELISGDRVMVRAGGQAVLRQGQCRFELMAQSILTLTEEDCLLCAAVATTREANVAYGQSGGGVAGGGVAAPSPTLAPVTSGAQLRLPRLLLDIGRGDPRPPTSQ